MQSSLNLKLLILISLIHGAYSLNSIAGEVFSENNLEVNALSSKLDILNQEKKINKSLFLPELSINTGIGSEKLIDNLNGTDKGPYLFLDGKINLYRGGRDSIQREKIQLKIDITRIEKEIKKRALRIESFKLITQINKLIEENSFINEELKSNSNGQLMARKKVDAGLTTSVDLLDFDLKNENLVNDREKNILRKEELEKDLMSLFGGNVSLQAIMDKNPIQLQVELNTNIQADKTPIIVLANRQIELSKFDQQIIDTEYLPSLDLEAKWGQITPQERFFNSDNREHQILLNINIPLFSGLSTSGKLQTAMLESTQTKRQTKQIEIETKSKIELELKKINLFKKIMQSLERSLSQSQKYRVLTIAEYKRGIKNSPDVISASDKKLEIERKMLETKTELAMATFSYNETFKAYKDE